MTISKYTRLVAHKLGISDLRASNFIIDGVSINIFEAWCATVAYNSHRRGINLNFGLSVLHSDKWQTGFLLAENIKEPDSDSSTQILQCDLSKWDDIVCKALHNVDIFPNDRTVPMSDTSLNFNIIAWTGYTVCHLGAKALVSNIKLRSLAEALLITSHTIAEATGDQQIQSLLKNLPQEWA